MVTPIKPEKLQQLHNIAKQKDAPKAHLKWPTAHDCIRMLEYFNNRVKPPTLFLKTPTGGEREFSIRVSNDKIFIRPLHSSLVPCGWFSKDSVEKLLASHNVIVPGANDGE